MEIDGGIATFPNGLKLRVNPAAISHQAVADSCAMHPDPLVPMVTVTINGQQVQEENPDDPEYKRRLDAAQQGRSWAAVRAFVIMGTRLEQAPEGAPGIDDDEGWEDLSYTRHVPIPTHPRERYETWLRYRGFEVGYERGARDGMPQFLELCQWLAFKSGLTLEAPTAIVATFRDNEERASDPAGATVAPAGDGDGRGDAAAAGLGY